MSGFGQPPGGAGGFGAPQGAPGAPMGQPMGQPAPGPMGAPAGPPPGDAPNFMLWLIVPIASAVMCGNVLFGAIAAILAFMGKQEWDQGNYESAQGKLKISKIITIITCALMGLAILAYVILMVVGLGAAAATAPPAY